jgi:two-component system response regulator VicR
MKILIVEDEEALSAVMREKLEKEDYEVEVVNNGEDAVPMCKKFNPDLIMLDLILPKKHGLEILKDLKADINLKGVPVIVLSNLDTDTDIKKALELGADDYFVKAHHPINEIVEKVKAYSIKGR